MRTIRHQVVEQDVDWKCASQSPLPISNRYAGQSQHTLREQFHVRTRASCPKESSPALQLFVQLSQALRRWRFEHSSRLPLRCEAHGAPGKSGDRANEQIVSDHVRFETETGQVV